MRRLVETRDASPPTPCRLSKPFLSASAFDSTSRLSSDWESTRLKIELSPVQIGEAAFLLLAVCSQQKRIRRDLSLEVAAAERSEADRLPPFKSGRRHFPAIVRRATQSRSAETHLSSPRPLRRVWLDEFRYRTAWNATANERRYDAPADP